MALNSTNVWADITVNFKKIVDSDTPIPKGVGNFHSFDSPYLYQGKVVFRGFGSHQQAGIYSDLFGELIVIADKKTPIPQGEGNFTAFGSPTPPPKLENIKSSYLAYNSPALNQKNIAFLGLGKSHQQGIYLFADGNLKKVADKKILVPSGKGLFQHFDGPYFNKGHVIFHATGDHQQQGIYQSIEKGSLKALYNTHTLIPNKKETFSTIWNPGFDDGYTAFRGTDQAGRLGVYDDVGGTLHTIADYTTSIPGGTGNFISVGGPSFNSGAVAFRGIGRGQQDGIYSDMSGSLKPIVTLQTPIPNGQGNFTGVFNPTIDQGNIVFSGTGVQGQQGIYLYVKNKLLKLIDVSDSLEEKEIAQLNLGAVSLSNNQIAVHVIFKDGSSGIYLATFHQQ